MGFPKGFPASSCTNILWAKSNILTSCREPAGKSRPGGGGANEGWTIRFWGSRDSKKKKKMLVPLPTSCTHLTFFASYYFSIILSESQFISLKCHGIYTLNEWNLWHVNYTSIRLFKSDGNGTSSGCSRSHHPCSPYCSSFLNLLGKPHASFLSCQYSSRPYWVHPLGSLLLP